MRPKTLISFIFALTSISALAQTKSTPYPDCLVAFTFTAVGTQVVPQSQNPIACNNWNFAYYNNAGFSALSIVVQTAPDNNGVPGSWSTFTAATGLNPNTATTSAAATFTGTFPWVRVNLSSKTGTGKVQGFLYGWKNAP